MQVRHHLRNFSKVTSILCDSLYLTYPYSFIMLHDSVIPFSLFESEEDTVACIGLKCLDCSRHTFLTNNPEPLTLNRKYSTTCRFCLYRSSHGTTRTDPVSSHTINHAFTDSCPSLQLTQWYSFTLQFYSFLCMRPNLGPKISTSSVWMRISRDCKEVGKSLFLT